MSQFLSGLGAGESGGVDVVTYHHYYTAGPGNPVVASQYTDPTFLNAFVQDAEQAEGQFLDYRKQKQNPNAQLWLGETSGAGGACANSHTVIGKFVGIFWYADKLGAAAAAGHTAVMKQEYADQVVATPGGGVTVTPEFWLSQLWKATMGQNVLSVAGDRSGLVRVYAHSPRNSSGSAVAAVVVINLGAAAATVNLTVVGSSSSSSSSKDGGGQPAGHAEFQLTSYPDPTALSSDQVALNGKQLLLGAAGAVPPFVPKQAAGSVVQAPPHSVTFCTY